MVRIAILRREPRASFSMDVYADGLVRGLRAVRPDWDILELQPSPTVPGGNPWWTGVQKYYRRYGQFPRAARRCEVDLFHITDHSDGHLAYELCHTGQPVVVTCHDLINWLQPENIRDQARLAPVSRAIWKYAVRGLRRADQIITVSHHTAQDVVRLLKVNPLGVTPVANGVDPAFRPLPAAAIATIRRRYQIDPDQFCLLHVGSNHPRKNVLALLRVLHQLRDEGWPVRLIKAGAAFNREQSALIADQALAHHLIHLERPDQAQLVDLYNAADLLVPPSLYEGFGITPLEVMACGTPVVTSNVTSLPEVVGAAGIMVDPHRLEAIAGAVRQLMQSEPERQRLIQLGQARVQDFTWEATAAQVAQVYEKLLDRAGDPCRKG